MSRNYVIRDRQWRDAVDGDSVPTDLRGKGEVFLINGHQIGAAGARYKMFSSELEGDFAAALWHNNGGQWLGFYGTMAEAKAAVQGAVIALNGRWFGCERCGRPEDPGKWHGGDALKARERCLNCAFWEDRIAQYQRRDGKLFVAEGVCYEFGEREPDDAALRRCADAYGFGGRPHLVSFRDGRPQRRTRNLWHRGTVPALFRDQLPDDADFAPVEPATPRSDG